MPTNKPIQTFFILGLPRSGTTLLEQILDGHSQVAVCPEMASAMTLWRLDATKYINDHWKNGLIIYYFYSRTNLFDDPINKCLAQQALSDFTFPVSIKKWYDMLIDNYLKEKNAGIFGEKTPENTFFVPVLNEAFPKARYITILRNPFDILVSIVESISLIENQSISNQLIYRFSTMVKRGMVAMQRNDKFVNPKHMSVTYEDLVYKPESVLKSICCFLNIEFEESMLKYQHRKKYLRDHTVMQKVLGKLNEPFTDQRIERAYSILKPEQYTFLYNFWAHELVKLPYTFPVPNPNLSFIMRLQLYLSKIAFFCKSYMWKEYVNKLRFKFYLVILRLPFKSNIREKILEKHMLDKADWSIIAENSTV